MDQTFMKIFLGISTISASGLLLSEPHQVHSHHSNTSFDINRINNGSLGPKITEIVKEKLKVGAKILQIGSVSKMFRKNFNIREGEKLFHASQCYLWTTAGPIAGCLFVSMDKIAFCSEKSIKTFSPAGELLKFKYKVSIPLGKVKGIRESTNMKMPTNKYLEIVTVDNFDFWFMGFLNYKKTLRYLHQATSIGALSD